MMLNKSVFLVLLWWLLSATSSFADVVPAGKQIHIKNFDFVLNEYVVTYLYLNNDDFKSVIYNSLERRLDEGGILAKKDGSEQAIDLDISIDYLRHFPGDATPFPSTSLSSPDIYIKIKITDATHTYLNYESGRLVGSVGSLFGSASDKDIYREMSYATELNNTIIEKINSVLLEKKPPTVTSLNEREKIAEEYLKLLSAARVAVADQYIPDSVADEYISRLQSADFKTRIVAYKEITRDWNNNKKLFSYIKDEIAKKYKIVTASDDIKEVREAMNCLASSGLSEYQDFLNEIKSNASNKDILDEVDDSKKILLKRVMQGKWVHSIKNSDSKESWKINQYARLLHLPDAKENSQAAKDVYLKHLDNAYLQSVLAEILESAAFTSSFKNSQNEDLQKWACRILGESKNKQYLPLLKKLETQAVLVGVQKYAKKFSQILEKS